MDREAWQATVGGITKSWTRFSMHTCMKDWKDLNHTVFLKKLLHEWIPWPLNLFGSISKRLSSYTPTCFLFTRTHFPDSECLNFSVCCNLDGWRMSQVIKSGSFLYNSLSLLCLCSLIFYSKKQKEIRAQLQQFDWKSSWLNIWVHYLHILFSI